VNVASCQPEAATRRQRLRRSFHAFLVGWAATVAFYLACWLVTVPGWGKGQSISTVFGFGGLILVYAAPVWLCVVLPLSLFVNARSALCSVWFAPLFGAACGSIAFQLEFIADAYMRRDVFMLLAAALIGGASWSVFAAWLRHASRDVERVELAR
jgi:hypothetical protein